MAQYGGNPDSATNEWYFNTQDNSSTLDSQDFQTSPACES